MEGTCSALGPPGGRPFSLRLHAATEDRASQSPCSGRRQISPPSLPRGLFTNNLIAATTLPTAPIQDRRARRGAGFVETFPSSRNLSPSPLCASATILPRPHCKCRYVTQIQITPSVRRDIRSAVTAPPFPSSSFLLSWLAVAHT